jgi:hypothetical protein
MKPRDWKPSAALAALLLLVAAASSSGEEPQLLWQIGQSDNDTAEFALGPKGYTQYDQDGLFLVGLSTPKRDWPYAHPGPDDVWADARRHTFTILFGLEGALQQGQARLVVDLVDTHGVNPPPERR